jgi:cellobiose epimerase
MTISWVQVAEFKRQIESEWRTDIAPFWLRYAPDEAHGGFRGWITNDLQIDEHADKGIILNTRILWTFSHAYRLYQDVAFRHLAERAYAYLIKHFIDREYGGVFWTVDYQGHPSDTKKRPYAQAFALYSLTEYYLATGERAALDQALAIFHLLENRCRDHENDGYFETFERDWQLAVDQRLSEVDQDDKKSMNTHLHALEAYATLCRATNDKQVKERLRALIEIFLNHIIDPRGTHLQMFFNEKWASQSVIRSFGHDIEASWLLCEAAEVLNDADLLARVQAAALKMAQSVYHRGLDTDGSLLYEADTHHITDDEKHWWPQAEAVVGFVNAYALSGSEHFMTAAMRAWDFIDRCIIDKQQGEWFWKTSRTGQPSPELPKLSQWKCPYHSGRMCFEVSRRLNDNKETPEHGSHEI